MTNGIGFDLFAAAQITQARTPLLDRRLVDLLLQMPLNYRLRYDPVHRAMKAVDPDLATIPNASSGVPAKYHSPWSYVRTR